MSEREEIAGYLWLDEDMPGFGVQDHGKHGYHPVRIADDGYDQLGPKTYGWYGYRSRSQAWGFIRRKYFPRTPLHGRYEKRKSA